MEYKKTGTREWAEVNKNHCLGCENDCRYCYARADAMRFKRIGGLGDWANQTLNEKRFNEKPRKVAGRIMYPSAHDIVPKFLNESIQYLERWLKVGNEILIVSKPNPICIRKIVDELGDYKDQMVFRFTIGSSDNEVLKFWERNAPTFHERHYCLALAYDNGFKTSVSCEPYLDNNIVPLVRILMPYVTDTIWVGKMNRIKQRVDLSDVPEGMNNQFVRLVMKSQTDDFIRQFVYPMLKDLPKVRWKESIKKVMGIAESEKVG